MGHGLRRIRHPHGKGIREKDFGLGQDLFPDQVLLYLLAASYKRVMAQSVVPNFTIIIAFMIGTD